MIWHPVAKKPHFRQYSRINVVPHEEPSKKQSVSIQVFNEIPQVFCKSSHSPQFFRDTIRFSSPYLIVKNYLPFRLKIRYRENRLMKAPRAAVYGGK